jgi:hypothetical protein
MEDEEFERLHVAALVYYAAGAPEYSGVMEQLTIGCSDAQWAHMQFLLRLADDALGESGAGSLWQRERLLAREEGRKSRYPSIFFIGPEEERQRIIEEIALDFQRRGIKYSEEG